MTASPVALSPANGRWWARSRRTISASRCASALSDFAPEVECRYRYRATDIGFSPYTV